MGAGDHPDGPSPCRRRPRRIRPPAPPAPVRGQQRRRASPPGRGRREGRVGTWRGFFRGTRREGGRGGTARGGGGRRRPIGGRAVTTTGPRRRRPRRGPAGGESPHRGGLESERAIPTCFRRSPTSEGRSSGRKPRSGHRGAGRLSPRQCRAGHASESAPRPATAKPRDLGRLAACSAGDTRSASSRSLSGVQGGTSLSTAALAPDDQAFGASLAARAEPRSESWHCGAVF